MKTGSKDKASLDWKWAEKWGTPAHKCGRSMAVSVDWLIPRIPNPRWISRFYESRRPTCQLALACWSSLSAGWKGISRHRAFQKGVSLLRAKSRDEAGTESTAGWPDRRGSADSFCDLIANFYSLKTKFLLEGWHQVIGWAAIGCLLEWASLLNWEKGGFLVIIQGAFGKVTKGLSQFWRWPWFWALLLRPWCEASHLWPWVGLNTALLCELRRLGRRGQHRISVGTGLVHVTLLQTLLTLREHLSI